LVLAKWKEQSRVVCHLQGDFTRPKTKFQMHVAFLFARRQYLSTCCFSPKVGKGQTAHVTCWRSFLAVDWDLVIFSSKDVTGSYDQNYFVSFYTNHVEMVQLAGSYFATCTPKLITLTFQHPKTPRSSLLLAGLTGLAMQCDFAWVWGA
jgi:hypothetical protein